MNNNSRKPSDPSIIFRLKHVEDEVSKLRSKPKKRDFWDKFTIVNTFFSSVIVVIIATFFTILFQLNEQNRSIIREREERERNKKLDILTEEQVKLRNMEAVARFLPYLSGNESNDDSKFLSLIAIDQFGSKELVARFSLAVGGEPAKRALTFISENSPDGCPSGSVIENAIDSLSDFPDASKPEIIKSNPIVYTLTSEDIFDLHKMNNFKFTSAKAVFGMRGFYPATPENSDFSKEHKIVIEDFNGRELSDLVGILDLNSMEFAIFPATTRPSTDTVERALSKDGFGANMLAPGQYTFIRGAHPRSTGRELAYLQHSQVLISRTSTDLKFFNIDDRFEIGGKVEDNIYATDRENRTFSSPGSIQVLGKSDLRRTEKNDSTGPWREFLINTEEEKIISFSLFDFDRVLSHLASNDNSERVYFGSHGEMVEELQKNLKSMDHDLDVTGILDFDTARHLIDFQAMNLPECNEVAYADESMIDMIGTNSRN